MRHSVLCAEKFLREALPSGTEPQGEGRGAATSTAQNELENIDCQLLPGEVRPELGHPRLQVSGNAGWAVRGRESTFCPSPDARSFSETCCSSFHMLILAILQTKGFWSHL